MKILKNKNIMLKKTNILKYLKLQFLIFFWEIKKFNLINYINQKIKLLIKKIFHKEEPKKINDNLNFKNL